MRYHTSPLFLVVKILCSLARANGDPVPNSPTSVLSPFHQLIATPTSPKRSRH